MVRLASRYVKQCFLQVVWYIFWFEYTIAMCAGRILKLFNGNRIAGFHMFLKFSAFVRRDHMTCHSSSTRNVNWLVSLFQNPCNRGLQTRRLHHNKTLGKVMQLIDSGRWNKMVCDTIPWSRPMHGRMAHSQAREILGEFQQLLLSTWKQCRIMLRRGHADGEKGAKFPSLWTRTPHVIITNNPFPGTGQGRSSGPLISAASASNSGWVTLTEWVN